MICLVQTQKDTLFRWIQSLAELNFLSSERPKEMLEYCVAQNDNVAILTSVLQCVTILEIRRQCCFNLETVLKCSLLLGMRVINQLR